jgi:dUTP pyrophosphatase
MTPKINNSLISFAKLYDDVIIPTRGTLQSIGLDVHAYFENLGAIKIMPGDRALIKTGLICAIPPLHYLRIAPRSGLAWKSGINVLAGVIDEDYRGEIGVVLHNTDCVPQFIKHGDKIAQLICERATIFAVEEVPLSAMDETERGDGGFGSTGK